MKLEFNCDKIVTQKKKKSLHGEGYARSFPPTLGSLINHIDKLPADKPLNICACPGSYKEVRSFWGLGKEWRVRCVSSLKSSSGQKWNVIHCIGPKVCHYLAEIWNLGLRFCGKLITNFSEIDYQASKLKFEDW